MRRVLAPLLLALLCTVAASARAATAPAEGVKAYLDAVTRAYGGRAALEKVAAYRLEGGVFSAMRHIEAHTVRVWAKPDRFKALINYPTSPEARVVNGADVWRNEPGGPLEPAEGPMRAAVVLQAARAGVPWTLLAHAADARVLADEPAPENVRGESLPGRLVCLEVPLTEGLVLHAWTDSTGHVVVTQGLMTRGTMRTHFETAYSDFRASGGVTFAFKERNWASGMQTGVTTVERVLVNPELRADEFTPAAAAGTPDSAH